MTIAFAIDGWADYVYWQKFDPDTLIRINDLTKDIRRDAFRGLGKAEPLKGNLTGYWSRRIAGEHRLVYRVQGIQPHQTLTIIQARFHYSEPGSLGKNLKFIHPTTGLRF